MATWSSLPDFEDADTLLLDHFPPSFQKASSGFPDFEDADTVLLDHLPHSSQKEIINSLYSYDDNNAMDVPDDNRRSQNREHRHSTEDTNSHVIIEIDDDNDTTDPYLSSDYLRTNENNLKKTKEIQVQGMKSKNALNSQRALMSIRAVKSEHAAKSKRSTELRNIFASSSSSSSSLMTPPSTPSPTLDIKDSNLPERDISQQALSYKPLPMVFIPSPEANEETIEGVGVPSKPPTLCDEATMPPHVTEQTSQTPSTQAIEKLWRTHTLSTSEILTSTVDVTSLDIGKQTCTSGILEENTWDSSSSSLPDVMKPPPSLSEIVTSPLLKPLIQQHVNTPNNRQSVPLSSCDPTLTPGLSETGISQNISTSSTTPQTKFPPTLTLIDTCPNLLSNNPFISHTPQEFQSTSIYKKLTPEKQQSFNELYKKRKSIMNILNKYPLDNVNQPENRSIVTFLNTNNEETISSNIQIRQINDKENKIDKTYSLQTVATKKKKVSFADNIRVLYYAKTNNSDLSPRPSTLKQRDTVIINRNSNYIKQKQTKLDKRFNVTRTNTHKVTREQGNENVPQPSTSQQQYSSSVTNNISNISPKCKKANLDNYSKLDISSEQNGIEQCTHTKSNRNCSNHGENCNQTDTDSTSYPLGENTNNFDIILKPSYSKLHRDKNYSSRCDSLKGKKTKIANVSIVQHASDIIDKSKNKKSRGSSKLRKRDKPTDPNLTPPKRSKNYASFLKSVQVPNPSYHQDNVSPNEVSESVNQKYELVSKAHSTNMISYSKNPQSNLIPTLKLKNINSLLARPNEAHSIISTTEDNQVLTPNITNRYQNNKLNIHFSQLLKDPIDFGTAAYPVIPNLSKNENGTNFFHPKPASSNDTLKTLPAQLDSTSFSNDISLSIAGPSECHSNCIPVVNLQSLNTQSNGIPDVPFYSRYRSNPLTNGIPGAYSLPPYIAGYKVMHVPNSMSSELNKPPLLPAPPSFWNEHF